MILPIPISLSYVWQTSFHLHIKITIKEHVILQPLQPCLRFHGSSESHHSLGPVATSVFKNASRDFLLLVREVYHLQLHIDTPRSDVHRHIACLSTANERGGFRVRQCEHRMATSYSRDEVFAPDRKVGRLPGFNAGFKLGQTIYKMNYLLFLNQEKCTGCLSGSTLGYIDGLGQLILWTCFWTWSGLDDWQQIWLRKRFSCWFSSVYIFSLVIPRMDIISQNIQAHSATLPKTLCLSLKRGIRARLYGKLHQATDYIITLSVLCNQVHFYWLTSSKQLSFSAVGYRPGSLAAGSDVVFTALKYSKEHTVFFTSQIYPKQFYEILRKWLVQQNLFGGLRPHISSMYYDDQ